MGGCEGGSSFMPHQEQHQPAYCIVYFVYHDISWLTQFILYFGRHYHPWLNLRVLRLLQFAIGCQV